MSVLVAESRHAIRSFRRNPVLPTLAVVALGLGIGANAAVFSVVDAVLFRGLTLPEPDRVVQVWDEFPSSLPGRAVQVSVPNFEDYRTHQTVFERFAAFQGSPFYHEEEGAQRSVSGLYATSDLLPILGVEPAVGRNFLPEEDVAGSAPAVILSHAYWTRHFDGDESVVGRTLTVSGFRMGEGFVSFPLEVVGVLPAGFQMPPLQLNDEFGTLRDADFLVGMGAWTWGRGNRGMFAYRLLGRLAPGATVERAQERMSTIAAGIAEVHPDTNEGYGVVVRALPELVEAAYARRLFLLWAAAFLVLLITCANVASLLLGRGLARARELAVRSALGAGRAAIARLLLVESAILGVAGALTGLALALWGTHALVELVPGDVYGLERAGVDGRVLVFTAVMAALAALLSGLWPALQMARPGALQALREGRGAGGGRGSRALGGLVVAEVALAFTLLMAAGLMLSTFANLMRVDAGFDPENALAAHIALPPPALSSHAGPNRAVLFRRIRDEVAALPGVFAVGFTDAIPLNRRGANSDITLADRPAPRPGEHPSVDWRRATPGFMEAAGIPLREGRTFTAEDLQAAEIARLDDRGEQPLPALPVIVNESLARRFWPGASALGKVFYWGIQDPATVVGGSYETGEWDERYPRPFPLQIVGVVADVKNQGLASDATPQYYTVENWGDVVLVRTRGEAAAGASALRARLEAVDPEIRVLEVKTMARHVLDATAEQRFQMLLLGTFGLLATVLAMVGVYGVMAHSVRRRSHEMGVRRSLGASGSDVVRLVYARAGRLIAAGIALGVLAAVALGRFMAGFLYGVEPGDWRTLLLVGVALATAGLAACLMPALRAARVDPMVTLRAD